jgi:two-component system cell cycle response regulator
MSPPVNAEAIPLRTRLVELEREVRDNESRQRQLFDSEVDVLQATTIPELLSALVDGLPRVFDLAGVTLVVGDPDDTLPSLLALRGDTLDNWPQVQVSNTINNCSPLYASLVEPWLGRFSKDLHGELFPSHVEAASVACISLDYRGERLGVLNLAARDAQRYSTDLGTILLERFGAIVAISLSNVIERERLLLLSLTDVLTGLPNRRHFLERAEQELSRAMRHGLATACVYVDADRFKLVNDDYGHGVGDEVLRELAIRLSDAVRTADTAARLGGEEFGLLLPQTTERQATELAERIRQSIAAAPIETSTGERLTITASFGVAAAVAESGEGNPQDYVNQLLECSDEALRHAKERGRNRVVAASELEQSSPSERWSD